MSIFEKTIDFFTRAATCLLLSTTLLTGAVRPIVMLTGFWSPSGRMISEFANDSRLNTGDWKGNNWEGMEVDIYSFFPNPDEYTGWFEVDYQNTWRDFWKLTDSLHPIAIVSFGVGSEGSDWEIEMNAHNLSEWIEDDISPNQPTPAYTSSTRQYSAHKLCSSCYHSCTGNC